MVYSDSDAVLRVINTALDPDDITELIKGSDAWIDKLLGAQSESDELIKKLSYLKTALVIKGRQPSTTGAGMYREVHDPVAEWNKEIDEIISLYSGGSAIVVGSAYQFIDEDGRYVNDIKTDEEG